MAKDFSDELKALLDDDEVPEAEVDSDEGDSQAEKPEKTAAKKNATRSGTKRTAGARPQAGNTSAVKPSRPAGHAGKARSGQASAAAAPPQASGAASAAPAPTTKGGGSNALIVVGLIANVIGIVLLVLLFAKLGAMNSRLDALQRGVASAEEKAVLAAKSSLIKVSTYNDPKTRPQTVITILDTDAAAESKLKINKQIVVPLEEK